MSGAGAARRRSRQRGQLGAIRRELRAANVLLEVRDARVPKLTATTHLLGDHARKCRGVVLAKADLACPESTQDWVSHLEEQGTPTVAVSLTAGGRPAAKSINGFLKRLSRNLRSALGVVRVAVIGLPNVGKSTLINCVTGRKRAPTGDRPGITKGKQWIRVGEDRLLLDTPGVIQLFAGMEARLGQAFFKLVLCNVVPAGQYEAKGIVDDFFRYLVEGNSEWPFPQYHPDLFGRLWEEASVSEVVEDYAQATGLLRCGGVPDEEGVAQRILRDFRRGKMGRLTLEDPGGDADSDG